jgi:hypothetical protein
MEEGVRKKDTENEINKNRRTFLTIGITGAAAFVIGKVFGPYLDAFVKPGDKVIDRKDFQNFSLIETNDEMLLTDKEGNDIFIIDKESFH